MESLKENLLHTWPGKGKLGRWIKKNFGSKKSQYSTKGSRCKMVNGKRVCTGPA